MAEDDRFFARWSRRKAQARAGAAPPAEAAQPTLPSDPLADARAEKAPLAPSAAAPGEGPASAEDRLPPAEPPPTLADVAALTRDSDFTRFVAPGVDEGVKRAALKKMFFSDPHFNVMDGLDVYIDDYNKPDPLPAAMLRRMWQSKALGLFDDEAQASPDGAAPAGLSECAAAPPDAPHLPDEDTDLRLQPDDDAGRPGAREGPGSGGG